MLTLNQIMCFPNSVVNTGIYMYVFIDSLAGSMLI